MTVGMEQEMGGLARARSEPVCKKIIFGQWLSAIAVKVHSIALRERQIKCAVTVTPCRQCDGGGTQPAEQPRGRRCALPRNEDAGEG